MNWHCSSIPVILNVYSLYAYPFLHCNFTKYVTIFLFPSITNRLKVTYCGRFFYWDEAMRITWWPVSDVNSVEYRKPVAFYLTWRQDVSVNASCYVTRREDWRYTPTSVRWTEELPRSHQIHKNTTDLPFYFCEILQVKTFSIFAPFILIVVYKCYSFYMWDKLVISMCISV